ncbi:MAG: c-type cytochrome [Bacteroidetes bacterium]|nr:c-type cytochrome [Bacteroidota bacterium]
MKHLFSVLSVLFILSIARAQNVSKTTNVFNEEGKLQMLIAYNPSCRCRTYTEFYPDGKVYAKRTFTVTDKGEFIDGEDLTYHPDGSIKIFKLWKNAFPEGRAFATYENGKTEYEEFFKDKLKVGTWRYFNEAGDLTKEKLFEGTHNSWNSKKDSYILKTYKGGKIISTEVFTAGSLSKSDRKEATNTLVHNPYSGISDGKKLFDLKCKACHSMDNDGYGPALKDVGLRRTNGWLIQMIADGNKLVASGDKEAVLLFEKYGGKKHISNENLTKQQIQSIIDYLKKPQ